MAEVMKFRKKPIVIEAVRATEVLSAAGGNWSALPEWIAVAYDAGDIIFGNREIHINTLEGWIIGSEGDWIIRGIKGELYPCKADIFEATYDAVPE